MIKALFFDLDGTLLNTKKGISNRTKNVLERCRENNIKLFIATARPPLLGKMLSWDDDTLSLFDGGSYYNGGCVMLDNQKSYIPISAGFVQKSINLVYQYNALNIALQLENEKHAFRLSLDKKVIRAGEYLPMKRLRLIASIICKQ